MKCCDGWFVVDHLDHFSSAFDFANQVQTRMDIHVTFRMVLK